MIPSEWCEQFRWDLQYLAVGCLWPGHVLLPCVILTVRTRDSFHVRLDSTTIPENFGRLVPDVAGSCDDVIPKGVTRCRSQEAVWKAEFDKTFVALRSFGCAGQEGYASGTSMLGKVRLERTI